MKTLLLATLIACSPAVAQTAPGKTTDGLTLLQQVARRYVDARSYYIHAEEVRHTIGAYDDTTQRTILTAAEAPGGRSYYEAHSPTGSAVKVSDGRTLWTYHLDEHRYTAAPSQTVNDQDHAATPFAEMAIMEAKMMRQVLSNTAKYLLSAQRLPDQAIKVNGRKVACYKVHVIDADQKRRSSAFDRTLWIDKQTMTLLKVSEHGPSWVMTGNTRLPMQSEQTVLYTETRLDQPIADSLFIFAPPADAQLVPAFSKNVFAPDLAGTKIPPLKLKSSDGKVVPIESFRGRPVLLDFWATWCGPCVATMPKLAAIYQEAKDKGLVLLSVDQDEEASKATDFFAKKKYTWTDYHDGDGSIQDLMGPYGIPRTILVDAKGQVVDDETGLDEDRLRTAIARLGPEYASLAPKAPAQTSDNSSADHAK